MPRIARQTLLDRFRAKIAAGQPIIGGGAGTGLSAKAEEAGGIDLIITIDACVGPGGKSYTIGGERLHLPGACGRACVCVLPLLSEPASPFLRRSLSQSHRAGPPIVQDKCNRWTASMRR